MGTLLLIVAVAIIGLIIFLRTPPHLLAAALRSSGPLLLMALGAVMIVLKQVGLGSMVLLAGFGLWRRSRGVGRIATPSSGPQRSSVRSAALEMELDHDTGAMNGLVLAGRFEGRELEELELADLEDLYMEIGGDVDSRNLLEAYLDRRFPAWREDAEMDADTGKARASGSGTMGEEEAYEVLGLSVGAGADEIRLAHRRLMKTAHPDNGGSTFLAAKINEAKDVLLKSHS